MTNKKQDIKTLTSKPFNPDDFKLKSLAGHHFHSIGKDGQIEWQGFVVSEVQPGWFMVQLYSWIDGRQTNRRLVPFQKMADWLFYFTNDDMQWEAEHGNARRLLKGMKVANCNEIFGALDG
jgi:hypothetical protein